MAGMILGTCFSTRKEKYAAIQFCSTKPFQVIIITVLKHVYNIRYLYKLSENTCFFKIKNNIFLLWFKLGGILQRIVRSGGKGAVSQRAGHCWGMNGILKSPLTPSQGSSLYHAL